MTKHPLNYQPPILSDEDRPARHAPSVTTGLIIGILVTIPALLLAYVMMVSDDGVLTFWIYPWPFLLWLSFWGVGRLLVLLFAMVQFPIYGVVFSFCANQKPRHRIVFLLILPIAHFSAVGACFALWKP